VSVPDISKKSKNGKGTPNGMQPATTNGKGNSKGIGKLKKSKKRGNIERA